MAQPGSSAIFDEQEIINSEIIRELHMPQIQENSKFHLKSFSRNHDVFGRKLTGFASFFSKEFKRNLTGLGDLVGFYLLGYESLPTKIGRNLPGFKNLLGFNSNASEFGRNLTSFKSFFSKEFERNLTGLGDLVGFFMVGFYRANYYKNRLFVQNSHFIQ
jgi:hypothetical protein